MCEVLMLVDKREMEIEGHKETEKLGSFSVFEINLLNHLSYTSLWGHSKIRVQMGGEGAGGGGGFEK